MTHAELRFCYRVPACCIKAGCFATPRVAGGIFYFVEDKRDAIQGGAPLGSIYDASARELARWALLWLGWKYHTA
ncbi:hypothetical protein LCGC14_0393830 [marine sediment metagenome]|uniref:Uncharacterized protein n=1 Tax=marine sediment metagenome TaxID=412755 RepID=A0A0F9W7L9_9ZZZZ